jgi:hypothetical protein
MSLFWYFGGRPYMYILTSIFFLDPPLDLTSVNSGH